MEVPGPLVSSRPGDTSVKWQLCYDMTAKMWWMEAYEGERVAGGRVHAVPGGSSAPAGVTSTSLAPSQRRPAPPPRAPPSRGRGELGLRREVAGGGGDTGVERERGARHPPPVLPGNHQPLIWAPGDTLNWLSLICHSALFTGPGAGAPDRPPLGAGSMAQPPDPLCPGHPSPLHEDPGGASAPQNQRQLVEGAGRHGWRSVAERRVGEATETAPGGGDVGVPASPLCPFAQPGSTAGNRRANDSRPLEGTPRQRTPTGMVLGLLVAVARLPSAPRLGTLLAGCLLQAAGGHGGLDRRRAYCALSLSPGQPAVTRQSTEPRAGPGCEELAGGGAQGRPGCNIGGWHACVPGQCHCLGPRARRARARLRAGARTRGRRARLEPPCRHANQEPAGYGLANENAPLRQTQSLGGGKGAAPTLRRPAEGGLRESAGGGGALRHRVPARSGGVCPRRPSGCERGSPRVWVTPQAVCVCATLQAPRVWVCAHGVRCVSVSESRRPGPRVSPSRLRVCVCVCVCVCVSARAPRRRWIRSLRSQPDPGPTTRGRRSPGLPSRGPGRGWRRSRSRRSPGRGAERPEARAARGTGGRAGRGEGPAGRGGGRGAPPPSRARSLPRAPSLAASSRRLRPPLAGDRARSLRRRPRLLAAAPWYVAAPTFVFARGVFGVVRGLRAKVARSGGAGGGGRLREGLEAGTPPARPSPRDPRPPIAPPPRLGAELARGGGPQVGGPSRAPRSWRGGRGSRERVPPPRGRAPAPSLAGPEEGGREGAARGARPPSAQPAEEPGPGRGRAAGRAGRGARRPPRGAPGRASAARQLAENGRCGEGRRARSGRRRAP
ncbi:collagen alpha-1(I) chain-like [Diceros bicornis minor]|uniref:collagen alpha-1(I) chain-like n=1 Tax=Diceros bicornis minor TaxID=77932 RepID=UPI0026F1462A|nr:collagen alpha-1(I) chain-like [Diceros bicornis minor]